MSQLKDRLNITPLVQEIRDHEGYEGMPYDDQNGKPHIGYGTLLPIDTTEALLLLQHRLEDKVAGLERNPVYTSLPEEAQAIIQNMAYQMGVGGVEGFKMMWAALERGDYKEAAAQMLDSLWARQTPARAQELSKKMAAISA